MPPQNPPTTKVPGEDVLLDTLRRSKLTDDQRQNIWDAYHTQGDKDAWVKGLNSSGLSDDIKQPLYDMRWKGWTNPPANGPDTTQNPKQPSDLELIAKQNPDIAELLKLQGIGQSLNASMREKQKLDTPLSGAQKWDKFVGQTVPELLSKSEKVLMQPIGKTLGLQDQTLSEAYGDKLAGKTPPASGGVSGAVADTRRLGSQVGLGIGDFAQSPAGLSAAFLTAITGGTAAGPIAAGFAAGQAPVAGEAINKARSQPTPENIQDALFQSAQVPAMAAGAGHGTPEAPAMGYNRVAPQLESLAKPGYTKGLPGAYQEAQAAPIATATPKGPISPAAPITYKSEAVAQVATAPKPSPIRLADTLRAENNDLKTRSMLASGDDKAVIQQRMNENHAMIADFEKQNLAPSQAQEIIAPTPESLRGLNSPMRPYDPTGTRFAKGNTLGIAPFEMPKEASQSPLNISSDSMGIKWAEDPVTKYRVSVPSRIADADVTAYARPKLAEQAEIHSNIQVRNNGLAEGPTKEDLIWRQTQYDELKATAGQNLFRTDAAPKTFQNRLRELVGSGLSADDIKEGMGRGLTHQELLNEAVQRRKEAGMSPFSSKPLPPRRMPRPQLTNDTPFSGPSDRNYIQSVITGQREPLSTEIRNIKQRMATMEAKPTSQPSVQVPQSVADGLPQQIHSNIDNMARLDELSAKASTLEQKTSIDARRAEVAKDTNTLWKAHRAGMTPEQTGSLTAQLQAEVAKHTEQAKVIRQIVKDKPAVAALRDAMAEGQPARVRVPEGSQVVPGGQISKKGSFIQIIDGMPFDARQAVHELMGSKMGEAFNEKEIARRARLREQGLDPDQVQPEGYRKLTAEEFKQTKDDAERQLKDLQGQLKQRVTEFAADQAEKNPSKVAEIGPDEFKDQAFKEGAKKLITSEHKETLTRLRGIIGWDPERPLYLGKGEPVVDEKGVVRPAGDVGEQTLKMAQQIFGKKLNKVPEDAAWENRAQAFETKASMLQKLVDSLTKKPKNDNGQAGAIGEARTTNNASGESAASQEAINRNASEKRQGISRVRIDTRSGKEIPLFGADAVDAKAGPYDRIEQRYSDGRSVTLDEGQRAIASRRAQQGAIGGAQIGAGQVAGAAVGGAVGYHLGGSTGAAIGAGVGYMGGGLIPIALKNSLRKIGPMVRGLNIPAADWLNGPKQEPAIGPMAQTIIDEQRKALVPPDVKFVQRMAQMPLDVHKNVMDKLVLISDRVGLFTNFLAKFDERGAAYRQLRGQLTDAQSPYVAARLAIGGAMGKLEVAMHDYQGLITEAQKAGKQDQLEQYLNLKGYQRAWDVVHEKVAERQQKLQLIDQMLNNQNFKLSTEQRAGLLQDKRLINRNMNELSAKMANAEVAPKGYTPQLIQKELGQMQSQLSPQDFGRIQGWAGQVFQMHSKVLDMLHSSGVVSSQDYAKYQARGAEYVPMSRILEDMSQNNANWDKQGKGSPLYLRQQNVIRELAGSDKTNVSPIVASAKANLEAIREVTRNAVISKQLDLAAADPQGVGQYFKKVPTGYQVKPGEGLVGVYKNGAPVTYAAPEWLSETLKGASPLSVDKALTAVPQFFANLLRKSATVANIGFSVNNAISHFASMAAMSEGGIKNPVLHPADAGKLIGQWVGSVKSMLTHDSDWREFMQSGAAYSSLQRAITPEQYINAERLGFKGKVARATILDRVANFNATVEDSTKLTNFKRMRAAGYGVEQAAFETRNYGGGPDFARQGSMSPVINLASMFFNAHLQYVSRVMSKIQQNPQRMGVVLGVVTALTLTQAQWNTSQTDSKGKPLMNGVSRNDRENYHIFLTGETALNTKGQEVPQYWKVRKSDFEKFLFNPIEGMIYKMAGQDNRTGTQMGLDTVNALIPGQGQLKEGELGKSAARTLVSSMNPMVKEPLEQAMNMDMRNGAPIVPGKQAKIDSEFQVSPTTNPAVAAMGQGGVSGAIAGTAVGSTLGGLYGGAKGMAVGGALGAGVGAAGLSPERLSHFIRGTMAGVGESSVDIGSTLAGNQTQHQQFPFQGQEALQNKPIVGPFLHRMTSTPINQAENDNERKFYDNVQQFSQYKNTADFLMKSGNPQAESYLTKNQVNITVGKMGDQLSQKIGKINSAIHTTQTAPDMSPKERMDSLRDLNTAKQIVMNAYQQLIQAAQAEKR